MEGEGGVLPEEPEPAVAVATVENALEQELASVGLPVSLIKRMAQNAAPTKRFSRESIAGFSRIAQAFICYATDGSIAEMKRDREKLKAVAGKRMNLSADHVMRFLNAKMPAIGTQVASLYPDTVPSEHRPAGIRLLEQLREQEKAKGVVEAITPPGSGASTELPAVGTSSLAQADLAGDDISLAALGQSATPSKRPLGESNSFQDVEAPAKKKAAKGGGPKPGKSTEIQKAPPKTSKEPSATASLKSFFGAPKSATTPTPCGGATLGAPGVSQGAVITDSSAPTAPSVPEARSAVDAP